MRKLAVGISALAVSALTAGAALAADLPVKAPVLQAAPIVAPYNWTGFYLGGNIGYSWGKADSDYVSDYVGVSGVKPDGIIGGGQIGYNWQVSPNWVIGLEADFQGSGQKDSAAAGSVILETGYGTLSASESYEAKLTWLGTVRGRIGYAFVPEVMVYGTGGLAYGRVSASYAWTGTLEREGGPVSVSGGASAADTRVGWTVGGGIEGAIPNSPNWTWKAEYLYVDLGRSTLNFDSLPVDVKFTDNIVRVGFNYRFR